METNELFPGVISCNLNCEPTESFLPRAPEICNLVQLFTISESVAAAAAVDVISQCSETRWMFVPCWFKTECETEMRCAHSAYCQSVVFLIESSSIPAVCNAECLCEILTFLCILL